MLRLLLLAALAPSSVAAQTDRQLIESHETRLRLLHELASGIGERLVTTMALAWAGVILGAFLLLWLLSTAVKLKKLEERPLFDASLQDRVQRMEVELAELRGRDAGRRDQR